MRLKSGSGSKYNEDPFGVYFENKKMLQKNGLNHYFQFKIVAYECDV